MSVWLRLAAFGLLLWSPVAAEANWGRGRSTSNTTTYYYPPVVVYVPIVAPAAPVFVAPALPYCPPPIVASPAPPPRIFATPTPAPPAAPPGGQPPPSQQPPGVGESRSFYDAYGVAVREESSASPERVSIGFWNHSSKDVVLKVDGQPRTLSHGQSVLLTLPRQFVWQIDERQPRNERVPAGQAGVDIVIRR
jgi:hypothetical protein